MRADILTGRFPEKLLFDKIRTDKVLYRLEILDGIVPFIKLSDMTMKFIDFKLDICFEIVPCKRFPLNFRTFNEVTLYMHSGKEVK